MGAQGVPAPSPSAAATRPLGLSRPFVGVVAFLTLIDLFAMQAVIPSITAAYGVGVGAAGLAVNACAFGMAAASLAVALFGAGIDRRRGVAASLALLAAPTALLAAAPDLAAFAALRVAQGLCMATAFTLTLTALGERLSGPAAAAAFAAYVTGNVASNLVGRLLAASAVGGLGLDGTFFLFAALNLAGAALVMLAGAAAPGADRVGPRARPAAAVLGLLRDRGVLASLVVGFCILFVFIGVFTYVNAALTAPPFGLGMMSLGLVYLVFLPSMATTPLAGRASARFGARGAVRLGLAIAGLGLPLLLVPALAGVLAGMTLVAIGAFFAQAVASGEAGRAAGAARAAGSGLYLASYFSGGLVGAAALGRVYDSWGWSGCVAGAAAALAAAAVAAAFLRRA